MASGLLVGTYASVAVLSLVFDRASSWRSVCAQLVVLYLVQVISGAALFYSAVDDISFEHVEFLLKKPPFIIAKYLYRFPWDGWGRLTGFAELLVLAYKRSKGTLEGDEPAPTMAPGHSSGRILAKMTASV